MSTPAAQHRTSRAGLGLICALSMLAAVTLLAGMLGWSRRAISLDDRISLEGWTISFMPPKRWQAGDFRSRVGRTIAFYQPGRQGGERALLVHQRANPMHDAPEQIAMSCLMEWGYRGLAGLFVPPGIRPIRGSFGPMQGAQVTDGKVLVSAGVNGTDAYCIGLISNVPLTAGDVHFLERVVDSTQVER